MIIELSEARLRRDVERLHRLGPRVLLEMLTELGCSRLLRIEIECLVSRYARIDPTTLTTMGGDRIPPPAAEIARHLDHALQELSDVERRVDDQVVLGCLTIIGFDIEDARAAVASDDAG
jgi:hypothetical protein